MKRVVHCPRQRPVGKARRDVEDRSGWAGYADAELNGDVAPPHRVRPVNAYAGRTAEFGAFYVAGTKYRGQEGKGNDSQQTINDKRTLDYYLFLFIYNTMLCAEMCRHKIISHSVKFDLNTVICKPGICQKWKMASHVRPRSIGNAVSRSAWPATPVSLLKWSLPPQWPSAAAFTGWRECQMPQSLAINGSHFGSIIIQQAMMEHIKANDIHLC